MEQFKYQFKILFGNKVTLFWTLLFPLCLACFFQMAFSGLLDDEKLEVFDVAIVEQQDNSDFNTLIEKISNGDNKMMNVRYVDEQKAKKLLSDEKISGYYVVSDSIDVYVNNKNINATIMTTIADNYMQTMSTYGNIAKLKPEIFYNGLINGIDLQRDNFKEEKINNLDMTVIYFYTLIGLTCLNGGSRAITVASFNEANLSKQGARINVAPLSKTKNLLIGLISAYIIHFIGSALLLFFLQFVLKINFGDQFLYILLLVAAGCFVGIALGNVIANILKTGKESKISILTSITLVCSFLSGMMGTTDLKYMIQESFPILAMINPVTLITDALYSLYYYNTLDLYIESILILIAIGIILSLISLFFMRRKQYDSI